jgi:hypothetical protein
MPEENNGGTEQQQPSQGDQGGQSGGGGHLPVDQPNTDVTAPKNIIQTEGVDYSKITTRDAGTSESKDE